MVLQVLQLQVDYFLITLELGDKFTSYVPLKVKFGSETKVNLVSMHVLMDIPTLIREYNHDPNLFLSGKNGYKTS